MDTIKERQKAAELFELAVAEALKTPHMVKHLKYTGKYSKLYLEGHGYVEEIELHIEFIKNLTALRIAVDNRANNPREIKQLRDSKDRKVKESAAKYIPSLKIILDAAVKAIKYDFEDFGINNSEKRIEVLKFLTTSLAATTELVNSKFQDPHKLDNFFRLIHPVETKGTKKLLDKPNWLALLCARHPNVTLMVGALTWSFGMTSILAGAVFCAAPGGLVIGLPMIAAGLALAPIGMKIFLAARKFVDESRAKIRKEEYELKLEKFGERYQKLIASPEVTKVFKNVDHIVRNAAEIELQPLQNKVDDGRGLGLRMARNKA
jgi:hypothetical protein